MILGIIGDSHFTNKSPERRLDDYWATQQDKLIQACEIFTREKCDCVCQTGDLFDHPNASNVVIARIINILNKYNFKLNIVFGNHEIAGHSISSLPSSPLSVLEAAGVVRILGARWLPNGTDDKHGIQILGAGFGEEVPIPPDDYKAYNILVIHKMVGDKLLFPGQELIDPRRFLVQYPLSLYNLVICGDYHYRFIYEYNNRIILNPGALVRETISEHDLAHRPAVVTFDTESGQAIVHELKVKPVEEVFDLTPVKTVDNTAVIKLIEDLKKSGRSQVGWKQILIKIFEQRSISDGAKKVIDEALEEINAK